MDKSYIFLKSPIGSGGEANIYAVRIKPELVAKIYHKPHGDYARKLAFMVANPPVDPLAKEGKVSIAWATELVTDLDRVVGFLMPKLDTSKAKPIFQYYNPSTRRKETPWFSYVYLLRTARNLAVAVNSVHARGYVIGDVNESNILVGVEDVIVTLVDTDSFQVNDGTTVYRCTVGKPEYTPPELQGMSFRDVDRSVEHDLFGLGVLIYQLLMEGTHPFGGVFTGQGEAPELKDRIKAGHFPHGRRSVPYKPMPLISFQMLPVALQELFLLCFEEGHGNPAARPTADVWSKALGVAEDGLVKCGVNGQHHYSGHLGVCPWCERAAKLGGRDPFPALGAIRAGQHLKPAAIGKAIEKPILKPKPNPPPTQPSTPNRLPSSIITPQVVIATPQTLSQPQPISQPAIANNPSISQSSISSYPTVSIKTSNLITSYGNELCKTIVLTICIILLAQNITVGLIGGAIFLVWEFISKSYNSCIVAFSPDGKTIITRGSGGTTKLWSIDGRLIQTLTWDSRHNTDKLAFSPDGRMLVTCGLLKCTAKLWSINGKLLQTFTGHSSYVSCVAFSPDGKMLATGSYDNAAKLWSLDGREIQTFTGHSWITSIAFSPDGKMIAAGGSKTVKLWSLDGREVQTFTWDSSNVSCVAFSPDGKMIAAGSRDTFSADGSNILSRDNTAKLWSIDGRLLQTFTGHKSSVSCVAFSPDGKMIATGSGDKIAKLWSLDGKELQTLAHSSSVNSVAFSPDGKMLATGSGYDNVKLWQI